MILPQNLHYFSKTVNKEIKEVYYFAAINALALALIFIFEPIYLFQAGYSLMHIMFYYLQVYAWYSILIFFGAHVSSKIGYKHSILLAALTYVCYWFVLYQSAHFYIFFFVAPFLFALEKSFFWPAYDADVSLSSLKSQRGREVGVLLSVVEVVSIAGPFIGGFISTTLGFSALFSIAGALVIIATYPLFKSKDIYSRHRFKFKNFTAMFKKYPWNFLGYWGYAEDLMTMSLWPLVIFSTVQYAVGVGAISTFASIISSMLMLYIGRLTDSWNKLRLIRINSSLYGLTWVFRFLAQGIVGVMAFDILTKTAKASVNVPVVSLSYELAGESGPDQAIAYSVFYEFSLSIGKILTCLAAMAIIHFTQNIYLVFALVGLLVTFYSFLRNK